MFFRDFLVSLAVCAALVAVSRGEESGFRVPEGFEVSLFAGDELAHDIYSMTIDSLGRVVVAGRGYVKILHDDNRDGRADRATLFSERPRSGAHGMYFDGPDLICTGDDSLMRLRDTDGDGRADGEPEVWSRLRHPEHGANGVVKGPDGWIYVICGNDAEVTEKHASTPYSPVKKPVCGAVVRFSPDGKQSEIFAHGFRNPYDLDFNAAGHLFTVDADGERDQYLPWYAPNRLFDIAQGRHHGWVLRGWTRSWNRPAYFFDSVDRLLEIGRGSPTGLVVYRHRQFPKEYRGSVLSACWTLGTIYHLPLEKSGSSYKSEKKIFMQTTGQVGFAPVDLAVGPEGDLFVAIGGRGTQGSVFRVRYTKAPAIAAPAPPKDDAEALDQVLSADQPLASWSRARWVPLAKRLGAQVFLDQAFDESNEPIRRARAVEIATEMFKGLSYSVVQSLLRSGNPVVRARTAWSLGTKPEAYLRTTQERVDLFATKLEKDLPGIMKKLPLAALQELEAPYGAWSSLWNRYVNDLDPHVARAACEAIVAARVPQKKLADGVTLDQVLSLPRVEITRTDVDARLREAWLALDTARLRRAPADRRKDSIDLLTQYFKLPPPEAAEKKVSQASGQLIARLLMGEGEPPDESLIEFCLRAVPESREGAPQLRFEVLRLMQLAVGDVRMTQDKPDLYTGYALAKPNSLPLDLQTQIVLKLSKVLPTEDLLVDREIARLLGMMQFAGHNQLERVALCLRPDATPEDDIHYLIVLSRLPGKRDDIVRLLTAAALAELHTKMVERKYVPSNNWPIVVGEVFDELCKRDEGLAAAVVARSGFGRVEHTLFALRMTGDTKIAATKKILARVEKEGEEARWSADLVKLAGDLPDGQALPKLREVWAQEPGLRDAVVLVLARSPVEEDRKTFGYALASPQPEVVRIAAVALAKLEPPKEAAEIMPVVRALREYLTPGRHADVRAALAALLAKWTRQSIVVDEGKSKDLAAVYKPWFDWFAAAHPKEAKKLAASAAPDAAAWAQRLSKVAWDAGDAARGRVVFERRSCGRCHGQNSRLGPDLIGVTRRLSREDLFTAIVDPNKDVSPLYQTTQVTTHTGQSHVGLLVYESPEGTLLQTGADTTIRITDEDTDRRRPSRQSLMPMGLLNGATDAEVAELYRFLQGRDAEK